MHVWVAGVLFDTPRAARAGRGGGGGGDGGGQGIIIVQTSYALVNYFVYYR